MKARCLVNMERAQLSRVWLNYCLCCNFEGVLRSRLHPAVINFNIISLRYRFCSRLIFVENYISRIKFSFYFLMCTVIVILLRLNNTFYINTSGCSFSLELVYINIFLHFFFQLLSRYVKITDRYRISIYISMQMTLHQHRS